MADVKNRRKARMTKRGERRERERLNLKWGKLDFVNEFHIYPHSNSFQQESVVIRFEFCRPQFGFFVKQGLERVQQNAHRLLGQVMMAASLVQK